MADQYYYYDPALAPEGFGLNNTGSICWFNSLLQMLLGLPALNRTILECETELSSNKLAKEYIKLLKATTGGSTGQQTDTAGASATILEAFILRARQLKIRVNMGAGQECADEGFVTFIELLKCKQVDRVFSNVYELIIDCTGCKRQVSTVRDEAFRIQLFTQVPLETKDLFCTFLRVHPSEVDYYRCDCGSTMTKFFRTEKLKMLREIVVIVFNKFITKEVRWFPQQLTFKSREGPNLEYELVSKIEHAGTRMSGHYWAHSLRNGKWLCFNDSSVSAGSPYPSANTFLVAYHLVRNAV
jgi:uncharacterized UBP type Zn finger protein